LVFQVALVIYMLQWVGTFYMYLLSFFTLGDKPASLGRAVRAYEFQYGYSFNVASVNTKLKLAVAASYISFLVMSMGMYYMAIFFIPEYRISITPFQEYEGWALFGVTMVMVVFSFEAIGGHSALTFPLLVFSYVTTKEFTFLAEELRKVLPQKGDTDFWRNRADDLETTGETAHVKITGNTAQVEREMACGDLQAGTCFDRIPTGMELKTNDGGPNLEAEKDDNDSIDDDFENNNDCFKEGDDLEAKTNDLDPYASVETTFDFLCERHESVCCIVNHVQSVSTHCLPAVYATFVVCLCFVVFQFASGEVGLGDIVGLSMVMSFVIVTALMYTFVGCGVHEAVRRLK
jgi:hypothetical protein